MSNSTIYEFMEEVFIEASTSMLTNNQLVKLKHPKTLEKYKILDPLLSENKKYSNTWKEIKVLLNSPNLSVENMEALIEIRKKIMEILSETTKNHPIYRL